MNDFTKEELQKLKWMLCEAGKGTQPLCYKIQSLIDNYCEHDEDEYVTELERSWQCTKCRKIWECL
jgi:hypothetical protein